MPSNAEPSLDRTAEEYAEGTPLAEGHSVWPPEMTTRGPVPFDPAPTVTRLAARGPIHPIEMADGARAWLVTGFDESRFVFSDPRFSVDPAAGLIDAEPRADGMFLTMDPPAHTRLRRLLTGQFTVRRMRLLEERITELAAELLTAMRAAGTSADLVSAYALPLPSLVICELLGVAYADRAEFQHRSAVMLGLDSSASNKQQAAVELYGFMLELVSSKRAAPADDLLSGLVSALTDRELVDIATLLLLAGHETTANMLALSAFALLQNPEQLTALRTEPELIDGAVEELLRYLSVIHLGPRRVATRDVAIGGQDIPAGATVFLSVPAANRDPQTWPDPDRLDLTRSRRPHVAFGHGPHQCLGQQLARIELRVGLPALFDGLPGLRLTVPAAEVSLRTDMAIFGAHELPVAWDD